MSDAAPTQIDMNTPAMRAIAANDPGRALNILKRALTITANDKTQTYGAGNSFNGVSTNTAKLTSNWVKNVNWYLAPPKSVP